MAGVAPTGCQRTWGDAIGAGSAWQSRRDGIFLLRTESWALGVPDRSRHASRVARRRRPGAVRESVDVWRP